MRKVLIIFLVAGLISQTESQRAEVNHFITDSHSAPSPERSGRIISNGCHDYTAIKGR